MARLRLQQRTLTEICERNIRAAGPRYTPITDPSAPNLTIASLLSAVEAIGLTQAYRVTITGKYEKLREAWSESPSYVRTLFDGRRDGVTELITLLEKLTQEPPGTSRETLQKLTAATTATDKTISGRQQELWKQQGESQERSEQRDSIERELSKLRSLQAALRDIDDFLDAPDSKLVVGNRLFIMG